MIEPTEISVQDAERHSIQAVPPGGFFLYNNVIYLRMDYDARPSQAERTVSVIAACSGQVVNLLDTATIVPIKRITAFT